jgi:hypothetical protein
MGIFYGSVPKTGGMYKSLAYKGKDVSKCFAKAYA